MPPALVKLVAMLLLVVQCTAAAVTAPGRVLCIPLGDCGNHERDEAPACGHCGIPPSSPVHEAISQPHQTQGHGLFLAALHPVDECGCHLHVPVPDGERLPSNHPGSGSDVRVLFEPLVVALVLTWGADPPREVVALRHPPDFDVSDQVLALKSTRLII